MRLINLGTPLERETELSLALRDEMNERAQKAG